MRQTNENCINNRKDLIAWKMTQFSTLMTSYYDVIV